MMSRRSLAPILAAAILGSLIGLWISPGRAYAIQVEPSTRTVERVRVTYVEPVAHRRVFLELNNGAAYIMRPCRYEDSHGCYWNARTRGNHAGRSFVNVRGDVLFLTRATIGSLS